MKVELVAKTTPLIEGVSTAEFAAYVARIGKVKDNPEKLMKYLIQHKHWSPFEHTYFTFKIRTSRAIGRELLRHLSFTYQELSQRYEPCMEFESIELRKQADNNRQASKSEISQFDIFNEISGDNEDANIAVERVLDEVLSLYKKLLELGVARECARFILPECTSTTILMTGCLRSWIHFLGLRTDIASQKEMRDIADEVKKVLTIEVPNVFTN